MKKMFTTRLSSILLGMILVVLCGSNAKAQVLTENFDGTFPPAGWTTFDNGVGTAVNWVQSATSFAGAGAAFSNYDCSVATNSEDWMVSPLVAITAGNSTLSYYHRQTFATAYGSIYEVRISTTSQTNMASFTSVDLLTEAQVPLTYGIHGVNLSAYVGQSVYIAFVHTQNCGDDYYIDELVVGPTPCLPPTGLAAANVAATTADITWTGTAGMHEVSVGPVGSPPSGGGLYPASPATVANLTGATTYDAYVRGVCEGGSELLITGAFDGPLSGGQPKAIELYAQDSIPDLSVYSVGSANNGSGTTAPAGEFTFPAISVSAGTYIHITSDSADFVTYFGSSADYVNSVAFINGDDAIELIRGGAVIDIFGVDTVDGTGQPWEHLDGWAYRKDFRGANGGMFVDSNWVFSGINAVDGCTANSTCSSVFPIGTYTGSFAASAWVGPITFQTACPGPILAPWVESFDGPSIPGCWSETNVSDPWRFSTGAGWEAGNAGDHTANGGNYAWLDASNHDDGDTATLTSPQIIVDSLTIPELYYWIYSNNTNDTTAHNTLLVDFFDGANWHRIDSIRDDLGPMWVERIIPIDTFNITGPVEIRYTNIGSFGSSFYNDILIDDVGVREQPTCPNPTNVSIDSLTDTTAFISFTSVAPGDTFYYAVVPQGMPPMPPFSQSTSTNITVTGLMPNTNYSFFLQEFCAVGDSSQFIGPFNFTTACPPNILYDDDSTAFQISGLPFNVSSSTFCNTDQIGNTAPDVWYQVTVDPCADTLNGSLCGSGFDTFIRLLDDTLGVVTTNDDNGPFCTGLQSSFSVPVTGGATYYIVVEGFGANAGAYTLDVSQNIGPSPDPSFSYSTGTYCQDSMMVLPVVTGDSGGVFTATGGLAIDSLTGEFSIGTVGSYTVAYTVDNGFCQLTDTFAVTVSAQDVAAFSYAADSVCSGGSNITPTITGTSGGTFTSVTGLVFVGSNGEIDVAASTPGTYSVTYLTSGACADSASASVTIIETPDASFTYAADTFCMGDTIFPLATANTAGGTYSAGTGLAIDPNTGEIDLVNSTLGTYTVNYDFSGFCPANATYSVTIKDCSVGLYDRLDDLSMYQVYPNPNSGRFNLVNQGIDKDVQIQVVDLQGKVMLDLETELIQGEQKQLDMGEVAAGTYFLRVVDGNKVANFKLNVIRD